MLTTARVTAVAIAATLIGFGMSADTRRSAVQPAPDAARYDRAGLKRVLEQHRLVTTANCVACHVDPKDGRGEDVRKMFDLHRGLPAKVTSCFECHAQPKPAAGDPR